MPRTSSCPIHSIRLVASLVAAALLCLVMGLVIAGTAGANIDSLLQPSFFAGALAGLGLFGVAGYIVVHRQVQVPLGKMSRDFTEAEDREGAERDYYLTIFNNFVTIVWRADSRGNVDYLNARWGEFTGCPLEDDLGQGWFARLHPEDRAHVEELFDHHMQSRTSYRSEYRLQHHSGEYRWVVDMGVPFSEPDGSHGGFIGACFDISEHRDMEERLREMNQTLERRVEEETAARLEQQQLLVQQSRIAAMGEMLSAIAHQWRQPLNILALYIQDICETYESGELTDEYLQRTAHKAIAQIEGMSRLIDSLSSYFEPRQKTEVFSLLQVIGQTYAMMAAELQHHGIDVLCRCGLHDSLHAVENCQSREHYLEFRVKGCRADFQQVILNILSNARDAILERKNRGRSAGEFVPKGSILIAIERQDAYTVVTIEDNGSGIDAEVASRIFDPYFTTKETGRGSGVITGSGLGLYMCKMIMEERMGGSIEVRRQSDGTAFTLQLPDVLHAEGISDVSEELI
ncbi:PAS domain-containing sensor histidine kinase [Desulfurispira natronophila]|uniref:histidine kinase n=1 Tax=Desulfurispira natronophila TaxID=682562 RepID=A0A7W7Y5A1_9BACT|nr:PAS domain-containing sensor histidine kinase [Desulfurispira natronophila]MBB5022361.1 PAS domain S-box-containing protein [Desulfurispira natronophila]